MLRLVLPADRNFSPFFAFLAKTRSKPPFGIPRAFQPPKTNTIIFLVILFRIGSHSILFGPLINFIESSHIGPLPRPSASAGHHRRCLPLSVLSSRRRRCWLVAIITVIVAAVVLSPLLPPAVAVDVAVAAAVAAAVAVAITAAAAFASS